MLLDFVSNFSVNNYDGYGLKVYGLIQMWYLTESFLYRQIHNKNVKKRVSEIKCKMYLHL